MKTLTNIECTSVSLRYRYNSNIFLNPLLAKTHLEILLCLTPDDYSSKPGDPLGRAKGLKTISLNPLLAKTHLEILLCLMPDDFTCQRETPWGLRWPNTVFKCLCLIHHKVRYTRGSLLPEHAPATRFRNKAPSSAPTISSEKNMLRNKTFAPEFCPLISNWFDTREQAPGANLLHDSVSGASSLVCTEICFAGACFRSKLPRVY